MSATLAAPRRASEVESYWRLAWQWRDEGKRHTWERCGCLCCADMREQLGMEPLPVRIGGYVLPSSRSDGSRS